MNYVGYDGLEQRYPFLKSSCLPSLVIFGPPGAGKSHLVKFVAQREQRQSGRRIFYFNSASDSFSELKDNLQQLKKERSKSTLFSREEETIPLVIMDEIHRLNKAQQDFLLGPIEAKEIILLATTTENPAYALRRALISRMQLIELSGHSEESLREVAKIKAAEQKRIISEERLDVLLKYAGGDARFVELALEIDENLSHEVFEKLLQQKARDYDAAGTRHYDVISAFIKSMRGSDPQAAMLYLAVMIDGGEDPVFIARRMIIFAAEDVGNSDPMALSVAMNACLGVEKVGMPEGRILLGQAASYLASTTKSNASYLAINEALAYVKEKSTIRPPSFLRSKEYLYPHDYPHSYVKQRYTEEENLPRFYRPKESGHERFFKSKLEGLGN